MTSNPGLMDVMLTFFIVLHHWPSISISKDSQIQLSLQYTALSAFSIISRTYPISAYSHINFISLFFSSCLMDMLVFSQEKNSFLLTMHRYLQPSLICLFAQLLSAVMLSWIFSNTLFSLGTHVLIISELHLLHLSNQIHCFHNRDPSTGCSGIRCFLL